MLRALELESNFAGQYFSSGLCERHGIKGCDEITLSAADSFNHMVTKTGCIGQQTKNPRTLNGPMALMLAGMR